MDNVAFISSGYGHTFAVKNDGSLWAWGDNSYGQLGDGTRVNKGIPTYILGGEENKSIQNNYEISVNVGDIIKFGGYDWRVLDIKDSKAFLVSDNILECREYNVESADSVTWENCTLRAYLNGEFYNNTFIDSEKARIAESIVISNDNPLSRALNGNNTTDKVFLLSIGEVLRYFGDSGQIIKGNSLISDVSTPI